MLWQQGHGPASTVERGEMGLSRHVTHLHSPNSSKVSVEEHSKGNGEMCLVPLFGIRGYATVRAPLSGVTGGRWAPSSSLSSLPFTLPFFPCPSPAPGKWGPTSPLLLHLWCLSPCGDHLSPSQRAQVGRLQGKLSPVFMCFHLYQVTRTLASMGVWQSHSDRSSLVVLVQDHWVGLFSCGL